MRWRPKQQPKRARQLRKLSKAVPPRRASTSKVGMRWPQAKLDKLLGKIIFEQPKTNEVGEILPMNINSSNAVLVSKKCRIGIIGYGPLVQNMAKQLKAKLFSWPPKIEDLKRVNVLIASSLGAFKIKFLREVSKRYPAMRLFCWWIGTDVLLTLENTKSYLKSIPATHLCVSPNLQTELASIGIKSEILTIPPALLKITGPCHWPKKYRVASYLPNNKFDFYGWSSLCKIAKRCPKIGFTIFGAQKKGLKAPPNISVVGWIDINKLWRTHNCLIRLTKHDGFPKCIIEAKQRGRVVITNHNFPYVIQMNDPIKIAAFINTQPNPSVIGCEYYKDFNYGLIKKKFGRQ